jgi:hypothetical protein
MVESADKRSGASDGEQTSPANKQNTDQDAQFGNQQDPLTRSGRGGPRTKPGKESSRGNSVTHGLTATGITELDDSDAYGSLVRRLPKARCPVGPLEEFLVRRIAFHMIRLQRAERLEAEYITGEA